jgi:hypothetical protein
MDLPVESFDLFLTSSDRAFQAENWPSSGLEAFDSGVIDPDMSRVVMRVEGR